MQFSFSILIIPTLLALATAAPTSENTALVLRSEDAAAYNCPPTEDKIKRGADLKCPYGSNTACYYCYCIRDGVAGDGPDGDLMCQAACATMC